MIFVGPLNRCHKHLNVTEFASIVSSSSRQELRSFMRRIRVPHPKNEDVGWLSPKRRDAAVRAGAIALKTEFEVTMIHLEWAQKNKKKAPRIRGLEIREVKCP